MIAANFVISSLYAKGLYTFSQIIPGSIQISFVNVDKPYQAWQTSSNFCNLWSTLSSLTNFVKLDQLDHIWWTLSSLTNFAKLYKAQSVFPTLLNFVKLDHALCNLVPPARPPRPFPPARPKMWSLQAIKSISLWSLHGGPLQLDVIFGVLGRPSFQDVVSSRHRAG